MVAIETVRREWPDVSTAILQDFFRPIRLKISGVLLKVFVTRRYKIISTSLQNVSTSPSSFLSPDFCLFFNHPEEAPGQRHVSGCGWGQISEVFSVRSKTVTSLTAAWVKRLCFLFWSEISVHSAHLELTILLTLHIFIFSLKLKKIRIYIGNNTSGVFLLYFFGFVSLFYRFVLKQIQCSVLHCPVDV